MSEGPAPAFRFKPLNDPAVAALLLAAVAAAVLNVVLIVLTAELSGGAAWGAALGELGGAVVNGWAIILLLTPMWIAVLAVTRILVTRVWPPSSLWKSVLIAGGGTALMAVLWGLVGAVVSLGVVGALQALGFAVVNAQWWLVLSLRVVTATVAVTTQTLLRRLLKADRA